MKKFKAFTLAEMLLTLSILGVIAAMTVPTLKSNLDLQSYASGCQKAYSSLKQATNAMTTDLGPLGFGANWADDAKVWKSFASKMNAVKVCTNSSGCMKAASTTLKGEDTTPWCNNSLLSADGITYNYEQSVAKSNLNTDYYKVGVTWPDAIGRFLVDVNGDKGPNAYGIDRFFFVLTKSKGLVPAGISATSSTSDCNMDGVGSHCAAAVIKKQKIDYVK